MRLFLLSLAVLDISAQTKLQSGIQKRGRRDNSILGFCNSYCKPTLAAVQEATCKKTTAIAVKTAIEKEAGLCKKTIAQAFNKTMAMEAKSCKKSIADAVNVEKEKEAAWCKKNSVMVEKVGPFKPSKINKIGDITKYYHNYEISMDLRFSELELQRGGTQLLVVSTTSSIDSTNSLLYLYPVLDSNNIFVHFYTGKSFGTYVKLEHKSIVFLKWHKLQAIQSSNDGVNCKQEIRINGKSIWSQSLKCPRTIKNTQHIYLAGNNNNVADVEVKNFRFLTQPLICGEV